MSMRLCREIGEKSDRRVGHWTSDSVETVGSKFEQIILILFRKEDSQSLIGRRQIQWDGQGLQAGQ